jgi:hypothetical protein
MGKELNEIKDLLEEHEKRIQRLESLFKESPSRTKKQDSIKEFIISKKPKNDVQKTLIIGYYLENYLDMGFFNKNDLLKAFSEAKEKAPPKDKIYDKIDANVGKGFMMVSPEKKDNKKAWVLTNTGEKFVENDLNE